MKPVTGFTWLHGVFQQPTTQSQVSDLQEWATSCILVRSAERSRREGTWRVVKARVWNLGGGVHLLCTHSFFMCVQT